MSAPCPNCQKPSREEFKPFCCKRCREVDLNRWFSGNYAIPAVELDDVDDDAIERALEEQQQQ